MKIAQSVVYYDTVRIQGVWFIRLYDVDHDEMGIVSEGGRPKAFSVEIDAKIHATSKGLTHVSKKDLKL